MVGPAGSGKTVLLAALARPDACVGIVPADVLRSLVFCDATMTVESLALELWDQLLVSVPGFATNAGGPGGGSARLAGSYRRRETRWQSMALTAPATNPPHERPHGTDKPDQSGSELQDHCYRLQHLPNCLDISGHEHLGTLR